MLSANPYVFARNRSNQAIYSLWKKIGLVTAAISGIIIYFVYGFSEESQNFLIYAFSLMVFIVLLLYTKKFINVVQDPGNPKRMVTNGDIRGKHFKYVEGIIASIISMGLSVITPYSFMVFFILLIKIGIEKAQEVSQ